MAGIAPCDETQMRSMLGGDAYVAHCIMLCALGSGGYTCARRHAMGSALSQGYVDVCGHAKNSFWLHFRHKILIKGNLYVAE